MDDVPGYLSVRYEDLVKNPVTTMEERVVIPLGLRYSGDMLTEGNPAMAGESRMKGWRLDELSAISDRSVSRFHDEPQERQDKIITALAHVRLKDEYQKRHHLSISSVEEYCKSANYAFLKSNNVLRRKFIRELKEERMRSVRALWFEKFPGTFNYPVELMAIENFE
jgi:hypothetical protein